MVQTTMERTDSAPVKAGVKTVAKAAKKPKRYVCIGQYDIERTPLYGPQARHGADADLLAWQAHRPERSGAKATEYGPLEDDMSVSRGTILIPGQSGLHAAHTALDAFFHDPCISLSLVRLRERIVIPSEEAVIGHRLVAERRQVVHTFTAQEVVNVVADWMQMLMERMESCVTDFPHYFPDPNAALEDIRTVLSGLPPFRADAAKEEHRGVWPRVCDRLDRFSFQCARFTKACRNQQQTYDALIRDLDLRFIAIAPDAVRHLWDEQEFEMGRKSLLSFDNQDGPGQAGQSPISGQEEGA